MEEIARDITQDEQTEQSTIDMNKSETNQKPRSHCPAHVEAVADDAL
jgi:hypothetical protein